MARTALTRPLPRLHSRLTLPEALWHALAAAGVAAFRSRSVHPPNRPTRSTYRLTSGPGWPLPSAGALKTKKPIGQALWRWVRNFDLAKLLASGSACPHQKTPLRNTDNSSLRTRSCMVCRTYKYFTTIPQPAPTQFFNVFYRESKRAKKAGNGLLNAREQFRRGCALEEQRLSCSAQPEQTSDSAADLPNSEAASEPRAPQSRSPAQVSEASMHRVCRWESTRWTSETSSSLRP